MKKIIVCLLVLALLASICACAFACKEKKDSADAGNAPATVEAATEKMRKAGYEIEVLDANVYDTEVHFYGLTTAGALKVFMAYIDGEHEEDDECITAILFDSEENAKAYYNDHKDQIIEDNENETTRGQSGKWVYGGTEAGVNAFLK